MDPSQMQPAPPLLLLELAEQAAWSVSSQPLRATATAVRLDYLATNASHGLSLLVTHEMGKAEIYALAGRRPLTHSTAWWQLRAECPPPQALHAAIRAAQPSPAPRSKLSEILHAAGWRSESWTVNSDYGTCTYSSPETARPVQAKFITPRKNKPAQWSIALPGVHLATASPTIPAPVLAAFLLTSALRNP